MLIEQEQLAAATGYTQPAKIAQCLRKQGIRVFRGKGGRVFAYSEDFHRDRQKTKGPNIAAITPKRSR